jgi:hypothetical protein
MSTGTSNHSALPVTGRSGNAVVFPQQQLDMFSHLSPRSFRISQLSGKISFATWKGYGLDGPGSIPGSARYFYLLYSVQTGSGVHPASYPMGTGGYVLWG